MKTLLIRYGAILALIVIFSALMLLTSTSKKDIGNSVSNPNGISSSFFVSGSDNIPTSYQSISPTTQETTSEESSFEEQTLSDFLKSYSYIEQGPPIGTEVTAEGDLAQLKQYGNTVGNIIKKYGDTPENEALILEQFITKSSSISAKNNLGVLAQAYLSISNELKTIDIPEIMRQFNEEFSLAHKNIGEGMNVLIEIGSNLTTEDFLAYNDSVIPFIDAYMNIAKLFRIYSIQFDENEPGSMFTLPF